MELFGEIISALWKVWAEMFVAFFSSLPRIISFILWVLSAIVILPCVYVAGELFPKWVDWGEDL